MTVFWLLLGALLGFDAALTYAWLTTRHANRSVVGRVSLYIRGEHIQTKPFTWQRKPW